MWTNLPRDLVYEILEHIENIDTRRILNLKIKRIDPVKLSTFANLFNVIPKPVIHPYSAYIQLGPLRPTHLNLDPDDEINKTRSLYIIERYAEGSIIFNDYYIEIMEHTMQEPKEPRGNYIEQTCLSQLERDWLYNKWDGTEEHYKTSSYKAVLHL